jgi:hypothetical protein
MVLHDGVTGMLLRRRHEARREPGRRAQLGLGIHCDLLSPYKQSGLTIKYNQGTNLG